MRLTHDLSKKEWLIDNEKLCRLSNNLGSKTSIFENSETRPMQTETIKWDNFRPNSNKSDSQLISDLGLLLVKESNWQNHSSKQNRLLRITKIILTQPIQRKRQVFAQGQLQEELCLKNQWWHEKQRLERQFLILTNS